MKSYWFRMWSLLLVGHTASLHLLTWWPSPFHWCSPSWTLASCLSRTTAGRSQHPGDQIYEETLQCCCYSVRPSQTILCWTGRRRWKSSSPPWWRSGMEFCQMKWRLDLYCERGCRSPRSRWWWWGCWRRLSYWTRSPNCSLAPETCEYHADSSDVLFCHLQYFRL